MFQIRAYLYQARSLIGSDASGLSDPYAVVYVGEFARSTQVIEETLSPTWDEVLVFDEILLYGMKEDIIKSPPTIVIEIYDQDKVGKSEFIGRALIKPIVKLKDNPYSSPSLQWFSIVRGGDEAGELLAAFEMLEMGLKLPKLIEGDAIATVNEGKTSPSPIIYPVPKDIRPRLAIFKLDVLFWGLRNLKRIHMMAVSKPRIDVECSGRIIYSSIIQNFNKDSNFSHMLKSLELELPIEYNFAPPISIRCVDCRSFGRYTLVGTHQISSTHKYLYTIPPAVDLSKFKKVAGKFLLSKEDHNSSSFPFGCDTDLPSQTTNYSTFSNEKM